MMSKRILELPEIKILSHSGMSDCVNCGVSSSYFCSVYFPVGAKNVKWDLPKLPATLEIKIFNNYYILTLCTNCNFIVI